jgi:MFS family permease
MVVAENLGFSANAVLPSVAEDVMGVGAGGFGLLVTALGAGSILGTLGLAALGDYRHKGLLLTGTVAGFGLLLIGLAAAEIFALGLVVCAGLGAAMAAVDALEWILLQAAVSDEYRGRAIGAWNFAIGFGWVGPVVLGAFASVVGLQVALTLFGAVLATVGVAVSRFGSLRSL